MNKAIEVAKGGGKVLTATFFTNANRIVIPGLKLDMDQESMMACIAELYGIDAPPSHGVLGKRKSQENDDGSRKRKKVDGSQDLAETQEAQKPAKSEGAVDASTGQNVGEKRKMIDRFIRPWISNH